MSYEGRHLRRVAAYPGAIANGASLGVTNVTTPDDNYPKTLVAAYITPSTALLRLQISGGGFQFEDLDASRCAAGNWPIAMNEPFPAYNLIAYNVINNTGGSVTPVVTFEYEPATSAAAVSRAPAGTVPPGA